jgi:dTDP-4-dehydrorhamnose reductase
VRVLVTGAGGQLGRDLASVFEAHDTLLLGHDSLDVTDAVAVEGVLTSAEPDVVVHAAAWTDVDGCENDPARAHLVNAIGTRNVAAAAGTAFLIVVSTDYVFDGRGQRAYVETDKTNPLQEYGRTKLDGELAALGETKRLAVARTAWLYGARTANGSPARNFVAAILKLSARGPIDVVDDQVGSPTWTSDLARALLHLAEEQAAGTYHIANSGAVSRYEFARQIVAGAGRDPETVRPVSTEQAAPRPATRPKYAPLEGKVWRKAGFDPLPPYDDALARALPDIIEANA